ncbi:MAG: alanine--glyoxylate aminotransferase family protein [Actinobacteria bacterium]|nr:alanine--glyoxylate aminotransferase family protein [Actinomycetota bacterium]
MSSQASVPSGHFFLPGPTEVRPEVSAAQTRQMIGHRGEAIRDLVAEIEGGLKRVFLTERPVVISTSSATGLMEAGVRNGVGTGRVLSLVNGAFSERFSRISLDCGHETDVWDVEWGLAHDSDELAERLAGGGYDAVTLSQSETSTGALQNLVAIAGVLSDHPETMLLVDSVTGVGGVEVRTDEWALDFVVTGSQKALALPPGLAFGVASEAMMERSKIAERKGFYFDLIPLFESLEKLETPATPAISLMYALQVQLSRMKQEGIENRWARHADMQRRTIDWVDSLQDRGLDVGVFAAEGHRSPTVSCLTMPGGHGGLAVVAEMLERGWVIGAGYGRLEDSTIRIGHMGDHTLDELNDLLAVLGEVLT